MKLKRRSSKFVVTIASSSGNLRQSRTSPTAATTDGRLNLLKTVLTKNGNHRSNEKIIQPSYNAEIIATSSVDGSKSTDGGTDLIAGTASAVSTFNIQVSPIIEANVTRFRLSERQLLEEQSKNTDCRILEDREPSSAFLNDVSLLLVPSAIESTITSSSPIETSQLLSQSSSQLENFNSQSKTVEVEHVSEQNSGNSGNSSNYSSVELF